jgi:acetyltransferase-like isoleucine patch superfamily enzyme
LFVKCFTSDIANVAIYDNFLEGAGYNLAFSVGGYSFGTDITVSGNRMYHTQFGAFNNEVGVLFKIFENNYSYTSESDAINNINGEELAIK